MLCSSFGIGLVQVNSVEIQSSWSTYFCDDTWIGDGYNNWWSGDTDTRRNRCNAGGDGDLDGGHNEGSEKFAFKGSIDHLDLYSL